MKKRKTLFLKEKKNKGQPSTFAGLFFSLLGSLNQRWEIFATELYSILITNQRKSRKRGCWIQKWGKLQNYYFYACYKKSYFLKKRHSGVLEWAKIRKLQHNVSFIFCNICKLLFLIFIWVFFFFQSAAVKYFCTVSEARTMHSVCQIFFHVSFWHDNYCYSWRQAKNHLKLLVPVHSCWWEIMPCVKSYFCKSIGQSEIFFTIYL